MLCLFSSTLPNSFLHLFTVLYSKSSSNNEFCHRVCTKVHLLICLNLLPNSLRNFQFLLWETINLCYLPSSHCLWCYRYLSYFPSVISLSRQMDPSPFGISEKPFSAFHHPWPSMLPFSMHFQRWVYPHWEGRARTVHSTHGQMGNIWWCDNVLSFVLISFTNNRSNSILLLRNGLIL